MKLLTPLPACAVALAALCAPAAQAQITDMLNAVPAFFSASQPAGAGSQAGANLSGTRMATLAGDAGPVAPSAAAAAEMTPDVNCNRPREQFNIGEKVMQYGGTAASLRLQRLIDTDFKQSDLAPDDRRMLEYLAQTTVWLPVSVENGMGTIYETAASWFKFGENLDPANALMLDEARVKLVKLQAATTDFPGEIKLTFNKDLADGAYARFGSVIQLSQGFLRGGFGEGGGDFVLAHELSHIYKRHAIKDLQYKLIASAEGWELARKVLQRARRGMQGASPIADGVFTLTVVPQVIDFARKMTVRFTSNQELEADACSSVWLKAIGENPIDAWKGFRASLAAASDQPGSYGSDHPPTEERERRFLIKVAAPATATTPPSGIAPIDLKGKGKGKAREKKK